MNKLGLILLTAAVSASVSFGTFKLMEAREQPLVATDDQSAPVRLTSDRESNSSFAGLTDLIPAANATTQSVVHIRVRLSNAANGAANPMEDFFGMPQRSAPVMASGSGVIISDDGYIVTNNHVVDGATDIQVVLPDKRTFSAKLIGHDPNTDLGLIKINAGGLTPVKIGNSDQVQVGEWVLAVGYPFSLSTTVTAGIVSAKERNIGILDRTTEDRENQGRRPVSTAVEAFIQTDAAINPGNSGGALVNANGELIGINAAIASQTGTFEGYGFAIPINLAKKVIADLRQYGAVRRGILGVSFPAPATEEQFLKQQGIAPGTLKGVYITGVQTGSAAAAGGLRQGDIIQSIDGSPINSSVAFSERIARHNPGDEVVLGYRRGNSTGTAHVVLKGQNDAGSIAGNAPAASAMFDKLGARFAPVNDAMKQHYRINAGVVVTDVADGGFFSEIGIRRGAVITSVNGKQVSNPNDLAAALSVANNGTIRIDGITPEGSRIVFSFSVGA